MEVREWFCSVTDFGTDSLETIRPSSVVSYALTQRVTRSSVSCRRKLKLFILTWKSGFQQYSTRRVVIAKISLVCRIHHVGARLAPGVNLKQAQVGMETSAAHFNGGTFAQFHVEVRSLMDEEVGDVENQLYYT